MDVLNITAPAKINLYLHVTGKRNDGYHLLDSVVCFTTFGDKISLNPSKPLSLNISGPYAAPLRLEDMNQNIIIRTIKSLAAFAKKEAIGEIHLHKNIPVAAGLGGGSSNAAAVIKLYEKLWNIKAPNELLLELGADVPVCYHAQTCHMEGIGEEISPCPSYFKDHHMIILNAGATLSTKDVFQNFQDKFFDTESELSLPFVKNAKNSLQNTAQKLCPVIKEHITALQEQEGCLFARMAGSGASVFGIFEDSALCQKAHETIKEKHPDWWNCKTQIV